jgi:hypothetical protein
MGILAYRSVKVNHGPPVPGAMLAASGLFVLLALLAQAQPARFAATALAWGVDVAAFMNLYPPVTGAGAPGIAPTPSGAAPLNLTGPQGSSA